MVANSLFITGTKTMRTWIKETGGSIKEPGITESRVKATRKLWLVPTPGSRVKATRKLSACTDTKEEMEVVLRQRANCQLVPTPRKDWKSC